MSTEHSESFDMVTKLEKEHEWLKNLIGEWRIEAEMTMEPGGPKMKSTGTSSVSDLGGLWAYAVNHDTMPDGNKMLSYFALGYDVTFKEYRASMVCSASSHLWKYVGELSDDGKTMTLTCEGPSMTEDNKTAMYRDVIQLIDKDHRTYTSYGQDDDGNWQEFMKADYYRV